MVAWALSGCHESQQVADFACWVATEVLLQQMAFFGRSLNRQDEENRQIRERGQREMFLTKNMKLFSELPEDFAKNDLIMLRRQHGIEGECGYIISRWLRAGIVERNGNRFRKRGSSVMNDE